MFVQYPSFEHHGIDLGDGTVMEYGGKETGSLSVRRVHHLDFFARGPVYVKTYPPGSTLHPRETVRRAWRRLREQRYSLIENNCEHFATWCKTGRSVSQQVDKAANAVLVGAVIGLLLTAANTK